MRVIRLQVSAMRYSPGGGTRECWIRGEERGGGGGCLLAGGISRGWPLRLTWQEDAHPDTEDVPPGRDGAGSCCGVACCDGWVCGCDWDCCWSCDGCCCCCCCCWLWSTPIRRYPACTRKSHTRLVLFTSIFTRSRASRRRNLPPRLAYSRTSVSLMTK
jgi:hypothetical protein